MGLAHFNSARDKVTVSIAASTDAAYYATVFAVSYDGFDPCKKVSAQKINKNTKEVTLDVEPNSTVKLYIWDSANSMQPLASPTTAFNP